MSNNDSNLLNKIENNNDKTIKRIDTLDEKYNLKIEEEEQAKIYENKYNEMNSELNKLRKVIAMKKIYAIK